MNLFSLILNTAGSNLIARSESLVDKLKQLGSDLGRAIGAAVGAPQPVPIPVRVEK